MFKRGPRSGLFWIDDLGVLSLHIDIHSGKGKLPLKQANYPVNLTTKSIRLALAQKAGWQSGYAADCNSVHAGSIPTPASILALSLSFSPPRRQAIRLIVIWLPYGFHMAAWLAI